MAEIGRRIAAWRKEQHLTQVQLADQAGVSRSTVKRLETGLGGDLRNFIRVLRPLGKSAGLNALLPELGPSPTDMLKLAGKARKRVRATAGPSAESRKEPWKWGDER